MDYAGSGSPPAAKDLEALSRRADECRRLARFFSKLFVEFEHLAADTIEFRLTGNALTASLNRAGHEVKSINIKPAWFEALSKWLAERAWNTPLSSKLADRRADELSDEFVAAVRSGDNVAIFQGKRSAKTLDLYQMELVPLPAAIERVGFLEYVHRACAEMMQAERGMILVSAPDRENLRRSRAAILSLSNAPYIGVAADPVVKSYVMNAAANDAMVVTMLSGDALDALLKLREHGYDYTKLVVAGSICQGFVRRSCTHCAREAAIDLKLIEALPPQLQPPPSVSYRIGRGCPQCGASGYWGTLGVQSVLLMDLPTREMLIMGEGQVSLIKHLYPLGLRSLLEDGVRKVTRGLTTFEAVYELVKTAPPAYLKAIDELRAQAARAPAAAVIRAARSQMPFRESEAKDSETAHDGPLFSVGPSGKPRPKPLLLLVEDDADQRTILELLYRSAGYEVTLAADGAEALIKAEKEMPDIIVTDLMMPKVDGAELVARLKRDPRLRRVPVLVLTVVADGDREYTLLDLGADDYCEKTIQRKILLKRTERLLRRAVPA